MTHHEHHDLRVDQVMRQFVSEVVLYLEVGGDHANARLNMIERGVPVSVQERVMTGKAVIH